ncbi:hypothetical protein [Parashewanella tropica]|uniref:hypothetical protein n=1 Tax=Parashewanella tropica TaxID=2547970 RepID=UPI0010597EF7|nr:hypothetical protein [Parashewanella tropica]
MISSKKISLFSICLGTILSGCSTSYNETIVTASGLTKGEYRQIGFSSQWEINSLIDINHDISIRILPSSWISLTHNREYCPKDNSVFYVMLWSQSGLTIDVSSSFFETSTKRVPISQVKIAETNKVIYSTKQDISAISIKKSKYTQHELQAFWKENNYKKMRLDDSRLYLEIQTTEFVGCPMDKYKLFLTFGDKESGETFTNTLYFYPVEFESFSG